MKALRVSLAFLLLLPMPDRAKEITTKAQKSSDSPTLTVAVVSPRCVFGDVDANLAHFEKLIEQAQAKGARLVCFPELALVSYSTHEDVLKSAEPIPGETIVNS